jgi:hypothetical protein
MPGAAAAPGEEKYTHSGRFLNFSTDPLHTPPGAPFAKIHGGQCVRRRLCSPILVALRRIARSQPEQGISLARASDLFELCKEGRF